ncbi:MAG TPA: CusA/CzcA family heavy metal efflux RND transporter [Cyclobacteriaceae bacterium]|nr:CusA/CzcA family heavy metal efflux RND transporter [Cyclobacteriaceae bacterium]
MLNGIISFSIRNKVVIGALTFALIAWGTYSLTKLPIDAVPDITNNQVQVLTVSPSLAANEIERLVTFPVEQTMATIPGITEMRSFSRFGLSVVTIVFTDDTDVYWARQQVNERLAVAKSQIPSGAGSPELGPVSTGLSEIYQYIIRPAKGYENKYDAMELRTIQDWIVRRQLLGTPGVADVSSWGGKLKQYEIAVNPDKLHAMNIGINEIFSALQKNNQNTGGAYIDQKPYAFFIRSEGLAQSLEDIEKIVIRNNTNGFPILVRDVAQVRFGNAIRYGAMTFNNEGEVVGAIVLMLKGANSSVVIRNVKERIEQIKKTLPEGVIIEPYLDRTKLVNNAINTVTKNLAEGALIVIFVLVLMLGNLRAGLVVASVIPLSMLFAIGLMRLFGVSGNLMSLGAIDFGLIVDGAVIIVEATLHHITSSQHPHRISQQEMDGEVKLAASKMMNSAAFGQIIILIVYLPILTLVGIEGKMFRPMAQAVSFAILGALVLSLTYVPVASSLFLSRNPLATKNISDKIINFFHRVYEPIISLALEKRKLVIGSSVVLFTLSLLLFLKLGGEFIPTLDEGDFAVETRIITGSSLTQMTETMQKSASVLLNNFPEVKEVVGKIGTSEIPTDPMPIENGDLIIVLKNRNEWVSGKTREELAGNMAAKLHASMPGVLFGFQQPIQMRFNELMTGARQDVVLKIYGEDLDQLVSYANQIGKIARTVNGAEDIYIEPVGGLPQIVVRFDRSKLAMFGLSIDEVNQVLRSGFAGESAGMVYEKERRFDLVIRLNQQNRRGIEDIKGLYVTTSDGRQIPLEQLASINYESGINQIQRDDAKRRIAVGFNIRGRDVESIVKEMNEKINKSLKMDPGYFLKYGGAFKNLEEAKQRLAITLPIVLLLIFVLLYFTFHSIRETLLIFSSIPLSAIGGVLALWLRGMPFSISAGVGFIALFGVAVLNGIVLISEFNRLRKEDDQMALKDIVHKGTQVRLRPVLMTALVASLGFLPMALSQTSGAEVQRPLATVVIGGLISATLLTLVVLPVLYTYFEKTKK